MKALKTTVSHNVKEREETILWILPLNKSYWGLFFWVETYPSSEFPGNPHSSFCVILLTNQQMDMAKTFMVEVISPV